MRVLVRPYCYQSKAIDCNDAINKSVETSFFFFLVLATYSIIKG